MKEVKPLNLFVRIQMSDTFRKVYLIDVRKIKKLRARQTPAIPTFELDGNSSKSGETEC